MSKPPVKQPEAATVQPTNQTRNQEVTTGQPANQESKGMPELLKKEAIQVDLKNYAPDQKSEHKVMDIRKIPKENIDFSDREERLKRSQARVKENPAADVRSHIDDGETEFVEKQLKQIEREHSNMKDM